MKKLTAVGTAVLLLFSRTEAQQQQTATFTSSSTLVVIDVSVKDKSGAAIEGLTRDDFTVSEDGKPQQVSVFDFQKLDAPAPSPALKPPESRQTAGSTAAPPETKPAVDPGRAAASSGMSQPVIRHQDRRLVVMLFDFTTMEDAEQVRVRKNAYDFIHNSLTPADLVSIIVSSTGGLKTLQDFTDDRDALEAAIRKFNVGEGSDLAGTMGSGSTADSSTYSADQSEFDVFNTDRKLSNIESIARLLGVYPEKKALIYFSSGITQQQGTSNQAQLVKAVNTAKKANVTIYPIDARGMSASAPGGDASQASGGGVSLFGASGGPGGPQSGGGRGGGANDAGLQTLSTLAADTGGTLFTDNNNLEVGLEQARNDLTSYYILGYYSTDSQPDGKFRTVQVKLSPRVQAASIDYRHGYFADKSFSKFTASDREAQLQQALMLGEPLTDLSLAGEINYFRLSRDRYFVPFSVKIPGSEIALAKSKGNAQTELEVVGQVTSEKGAIVGTMRESIRLKLAESTVAQLNARPVVYDTAFTLPPGKYKLKFLARENETGKMGTFEADFTVPDLSGDTPAWIKTSSVVWSNQLQSRKEAIASADPKSKLADASPLVANGLQLVPSITKVFRKDQSLYVYFEVYDPAPGPDQKPSVAATLSFFRGKIKSFESQPVQVNAFAAQRAQALPFRFEVPLRQLAAGQYIVQLNVVDENGERFGMQRAALVVLPVQHAPAEN